MKTVKPMKTETVSKFNETFLAASEALDLGLQDVEFETITSGKKNEPDIKVTWTKLGEGGGDITPETTRKVCLGNG